MNKTNFAIKVDYNQEDTARYIKSFMFIKGFAIGRGLRQTLIALSLARRLHEGQHRKDGKPYLIHPLKVCSTLISYGIADDATLAAALLHDVLEDCSDRLDSERDLITSFSLSEEVLFLVKLLSKHSGATQEELAVYFEQIALNPKASLIKLSDRLHNSSTLYALPNDKLDKYIKETEDFVLPMASYGMAFYPEYTNTFSILKCNIATINNVMKVMHAKLSS